MTADVLRKKFLDFFKSKKHKIVASDSLVPADDPTVLFTPAGMNQFKKQFMGVITDFTRAASSQRCLRTDDLDKVGKTSVHHTFFEMLGNFSFGDYFKDEAISWAWEFLTEELKIDEKKLWVSVYKDDDEAYKIWKDKIKVPQNRIVKLGDHDNFWPADAKEKGPNGPCGPCSEIFFDFGEDVGCREKICDPSCSCGRFAEIWNLVFTQFNRKEGGSLEPLPKKNIDTGMGLERLAAVMQGKKNNFETELFQPLIKELVSCVMCHVSNEKELSYAISDHLRAIVFAIFDGVLPSNEGRGYVIRKLIRKSSLHLRQSFGIKQPFLYTLVPVLAQIMREPYPELEGRRENIAEIILNEEKNFISVLSSSENILKEKFKDLLKKQDPEKVGSIAFQLYDTYGLPYEITQAWLDKNKIKISVTSFNQEMEKQKSRSKLQSTMKGDVFSIKDLHLGAKATRFVGYKDFQDAAKILKIVKDGLEVKKISKGEEARIILDKTPFYAESGGQVGDSGIIFKGKNIFEVKDTLKCDKISVHVGRVKEGSLKVQDEIKATVDLERRLAIARNHTATHLLQAALRKILGPHVKQQGSFVGPEYLRFDFTHFKDVSNEDLERVEEEVYNCVIADTLLKTKEMTLAQAKKSGALAFFGEKYEDKVRIVAVGEISKEFCGGTHLDSTGQIGLFKITKEGSVASGIRRIEAVTGIVAFELVKKEKDNLLEEIQRKIIQQKELEKRFNQQKLSEGSEKINAISNDPEIINGKNVYLGAWDNLEAGLLRKSIDSLREKANNSNTIAALGSSLNGKAVLIIGITPDLCLKGWSAMDLIKEVAVVLGGSGGGRKDFAQAGGNDPAAFPAAFDKLREIIRSSSL